MNQAPTTPNQSPKTLSELADEYETNIPILEGIISELSERFRTGLNRADTKKQIAVVEEMLSDTKAVIYEMRHYYDK